MSTRTLIAALVTLVLFLTPAFAQTQRGSTGDANSTDAKSKLRTWSDRTGKHSVEAEFVDLKDGVVRLRRASGKVVSVPLNKLGDEDQKVARQLAAAQKKGPAEQTPAPKTPQKNSPEPKDEAAAATKLDPEFEEQLDGLLTKTRPSFRRIELDKEHAKDVIAVAVSADGKRVSSSSSDGAVIVWDIEKAEPLSRFKATALINPIALSPDGTFAFGSGAGSIYVWNAETGKQIHRLTGHKAPVSGIVCALDNAGLVSLDSAGEFRRWDLKTGEGKVIDEVALGGKAPAYWAISPDTKIGIADAPDEQRLVGWDYSGEQPRKVDVKLREPVRTASLGPDGKAVFGFERRGLIGMATAARNFGVGAAMQTTLGRVHLLRYLSDGETVAHIASTYEKIEYWSLKPRPDSVSIRVPATPAEKAIRTCSAISDDGQTVAQGHRDGTVSVWQIPHVPQSRMKLAISLYETLTKPFAEKKYDQLDAIAAKLHRDGSLAPWDGGGLVASQFYGFLGEPKSNSFFGRPVHRNNLKAWVEARPKSQPARIALAQYYIWEAWRNRGSGFASSVSESAWKEFKKHMDLAKETLQEAEKLPGDDPERYALLIQVAKAQSWPRDQTRAVVDELLKKHPTYYPAHQAMAELLMPRWGGEPGELEEYAEEVADKIGGKEGSKVYARIARTLFNYHPDRELLLRVRFDYPRCRDGFAALLERQPNSAELNSRACQLAMIGGDVEMTRHYLGRMHELGIPPIRRYWHTFQYQMWKEWYEAGPNPREIGWVMAPSQHVQHAAILPDGKSLMTVGWPSFGRARLCLWDLEKRSLQLSTGIIPARLTGVAISPDGKRVVVTGRPEGDGGTVVFLNLDAEQSFREVPEIDAPIEAVAASHDGKHFALIGSDNRVRIYDADMTNLVQTIPTTRGGRSLYFLPDNKHVLVGSSAQQYAICNLAGGPSPDFNLPGQPAPSDRLLLSPDGTKLYAPQNNGDMLVYSFADRKRQASLKTAARLRAIAISPDGRLVATATHDDEVVVTDLTTQKEKCRFKMRIIGALSFSPDSSKLVGTSYDRVMLWNVK